MGVNRCLNSVGCRVVRGGSSGEKMKETSCLLGVEPVAGKSTVKEAIYLCKSLPVTDSPGPRGAIVNRPRQRKRSCLDALSRGMTL